MGRHPLALGVAGDEFLTVPGNVSSVRDREDMAKVIELQEEMIGAMALMMKERLNEVWVGPIYTKKDALERKRYMISRLTNFVINMQATIEEFCHLSGVEHQRLVNMRDELRMFVERTLREQDPAILSDESICLALQGLQKHCRANLKERGEARTLLVEDEDKSKYKRETRMDWIRHKVATITSASTQSTPSNLS